MGNPASAAFLGVLCWWQLTLSGYEATAERSVAFTPGRHIHKIMHYTAQGKPNEAIRKQMMKDIRGAGFPVGRE